MLHDPRPRTIATMAQPRAHIPLPEAGPSALPRSDGAHARSSAAAGLCGCVTRCCGKGEPVEKKKSDPLAYKRFCTDILMCIFFAVFCIILLLIFIFAMNTGDYYGLLYDADYLGNRCGVGKFGHAKKAFYPRIPRDMAAQIASS